MSGSGTKCQNLAGFPEIPGFPGFPRFPRISQKSQDFPEIPGSDRKSQDLAGFPDLARKVLLRAISGPFWVRSVSKNDKKSDFFEKKWFFRHFWELAAPLYGPKVLRKARAEPKNVLKSARGVPVFGKSGFYPPDSWWAFVTFSP